MRAAILRSGMLLALAALGASAATAQTELFFATGVDSTGWAQAQSNADGHVLIESPQYPRGLWLHLVDEAGDALAGLQVEYQGRPDSLAAIRCVDPAGGVRETLVWTRAGGDSLHLTLKPSESTYLPAGLASIDWQINPITASLLEPRVETRLIGWEALAAFLRARWQGRTGRIAIRIDANTLAVELGHPETVETLVAHLRQMQQLAAASIGEIDPLEMQVFTGSLGLREGVILRYASLFNDSNLEEAVRQVLGRQQGRLTLEEVASLTELRATRKFIRSLVGIEHFVSLQQLDLYGNWWIVDITPLKQLNNLRYLDLGNNQIVDITSLKQLNNLRYLSLAGRNQIVDITPLKQLSNLIQLRLFGNQIVDITPLKQLSNLIQLRLFGNQIVDITPLKQLSNLRYLDLRLFGNQIVDITPLKQLSNLIQLRLFGNQIVDITPLKQLSNLRYLDLDYNQIVDITPLTNLTNLEALGLSNSQIADLTPLTNLTNLKRLRLNKSQIADLTPLTNLTNLEALDLNNSQIADLTPLTNLTNLEFLSMERNQMVDLPPLAGLTNLKFLWMKYNQISDLTSLAALKNLENLSLSNNQIEDLTPLTNLTNLTVLSLSHNEIVDITPLTPLTNLRTLRLGDNQIEDLAPLTANTGLSEGDEVFLEGNPLSNQAHSEQIPALKARGVRVSH